MGRGKTREKGVIIERQIQALDLRKAGYSYRAIGDRLNVTHVQAFRDVKCELDRLSEISLNSASDLRQMELERLDKAIKGLMPFVEAGSAIHVSSLVKVIGERAKLLGLYAPEKVENQVTVVNELSESEREREISKLLNLAREREIAATPAATTIH